MQDAAQCKLPRNRPPPAAILIEGPTPPRTRSLEPRAPRYVVTYDAGQADAEPRSAPARLVRSSFGASTSLSSAARNAAAADADPENPEPPPVCAVCLDEMMGDERAVTELPCGHQFHSACISDQPKSAALLKELGCDTTLKTKDGETGEQLAKRKGNRKVLEQLRTAQ